MSNASASENVQCVNLPRVTGADIPEELFEHILWRLKTPSWTRGQGYPPSRDSTVLTLTSLSLVCKYFARICRKKLYQNVSFRNQGQVARLLDLVDGGCAPLGKPFTAFTEYIHIDSGEGEIPWAHRISTVLIPRIKNDNIGIIRHVTLNTDKALAGLYASRPPPDPSSFPVPGFCAVGVAQCSFQTLGRSHSLLICFLWPTNGDSADVHLRRSRRTTCHVPPA